MKIKNVLFDLDGTLTDPKIGITKSIQHVFKSFSLPVPKTEDLLWCIGPSIMESMNQLMPPDIDITMAVEIYRQRYKNIGLLENNIYSGIPEVLHCLQQEGFNLYVATAKPTVFAIPILKHFSLCHYFQRIYGSNLDGTMSDKTELLTSIIDNECLDPQETIMVGDRKFDIIAAKENKIISAAVTWGYGSALEIEEHSPDVTFQSVMDMKKRLFSGLISR